MKRTKIISVLLAASVAVTVFAGCKKKEPKASSAVIVVTQQTATEQTTTTVETTNDYPAPIINTEATSETFMTVATTETTKKPTPTPKPTSTPAPTPSVKIASHVKDEANVIKDDAALEARLAEFEKATKIIPVVYTVKTNLKGDDFRTYVKNIYKNNYKDQNHFLIVYRVAKSGGGWSWTSSIGTKAYNKLKKAGVSGTYSADLSKALSGSKDKGKAFISFFNDTQKKLGK
ncbi:MAG: TPM domain-containing protein [Ruminococcaceae bacterium]|nr:TPM domain-containing protein [Oscillospiraceae bacterium]